ncbi:MAG TPA: patatin-like phospholipase family protein [Nitrososphaera sp.]|nr:patatin-like phospholipase family protein [Nitrososphaera sp.]
MSASESPPHPLYSASKRHTASRRTENVLVLQGGGSLGAFGCGVFKALHNNIHFDIVGGTSIGAVNAAIICGSRSENPVDDLENFWLEIAESSYQLIPDAFFSYYDFIKNVFGIRQIPFGVLNAILFGVPKLFTPRWQIPNFMIGSGAELADWMTWPMDWTYYYDHSPLAKTLERYIDYTKLSNRAKKNTGQEKESSTSTRLIITAVNVLTAKALVFDSAKMEIEPKHILASTAYSAYGFPWIEVNKHTYAWDGSLLSNTPLKEVIEASPRNDKNVYIVENYPRQIDRLPNNRSEVIDRTRDIIFSDKTIYDLRAWSHMSRQTEFIEKLYIVLESSAGKLSLDKTIIDDLRKEYENLVGNYGAEILSIHRIARNRMESPHILKNADFSIKTIKDLIRQGEQKTEEHFKGYEDIELSELTRLLYSE